MPRESFVSTSTKMTASNLDSLRIVEKYELTGTSNILVQGTGDNNKLLTICGDDVTQTTKNFFPNFCREAFLPRGYPHTVSGDYFQYQFYDTVQAFCSRITGTISTKAILQGVGVGNAEATALGAALTWIFKDGTGMLGGIIFAWWKGSEFDTDCKKWRLFADILNDMAMFIELLLPALPGYTLLILCFTTCMKSAVGVSGGATRAAITQHQALVGNSADVSAKDGSQETAVNLVASIFSIFILTFIGDGRFEWTIFVLFTVIHLLSNYWAVSSLVFDTLNQARFVIIMKSYCRFNKVPDLENVNRKESVILGSGTSAKEFCGFDIKLGDSFKPIIKSMSVDELSRILSIYKHKQYFILPSMEEKCLRVVLAKTITAERILHAYFHSILLGFAFSMRQNAQLEYLQKKVFVKDSVLERLQEILSDNDNDQSVTMATVNNIVTKEINNFVDELKRNDWNLQMHSFKLYGWRMEADTV